MKVDDAITTELKKNNLTTKKRSPKDIKTVIKITTMNTIKFTPSGKIESITVNGYKTILKGYLIGYLPNNIGCIETRNETAGINSWMNYKGITYIAE